MEYDQVLVEQVKQAYQQSGAASSGAPARTLSQWFYKAQSDGRISATMIRKLRRYLGFGSKRFQPHLQSMLRQLSS